MYSSSVPRADDMPGPVPATATPRPAVANRRAAATKSSTGMSARRATVAGSNGSTARRSSSRPCVSAATNSWS